MAGLLIATGFGWLLNFLLVASFIWSELLPVPCLVIGWLVMAAGWGFSAWRSFSGVSEMWDGRSAVATEDLFLQAQIEYLKGHWCEAESLLERLVRWVEMWRPI